MDFYFVAALFIVAFLYASVGHGGASGYLALMALWGIETIYMRSSALTLNLFVSGVSFYAFQRKGHFKLKVLLPFIMGSVPMAFVGASLNVNPYIYKIILALFLAFAIYRMFFGKKANVTETTNSHFLVAVGIGVVLGFFSGMIGIGGGIILSPVLLLLRWATVKETAGISAVFIFVNSASGLVGVWLSNNYSPNPNMWVWIVAAFIGGLLGGYVGSTKLTEFKLKYMLAFILLLASLKLAFV